jgi:hypothetical protein
MPKRKPNQLVIRAKDPKEGMTADEVKKALERATEAGFPHLERTRTNFRDRIVWMQFQPAPEPKESLDVWGRKAS